MSFVVNAPFRTLVIRYKVGWVKKNIKVLMIDDSIDLYLLVKNDYFNIWRADLKSFQKNQYPIHVLI